MNTSVAGSQYLVASKNASLLRARRARAGISLLEVLFAVGVLSVGILAMAALIPLGAYELLEAQKLDQSATLGRAAFRDLEIRGLLQPKLWVDTQVGMLIDPDPTNSVDPTPGDQYFTYNKRIISYPYLPLGCQTYFPSPPLQYSGTPAVTWPTAAFPDPSTQKHLYPLFMSANVLRQYTTPIAVSIIPMLLNPTNPNPPYPNTTFSEYPPFAATDSPVLVLDPLLVGETVDTAPLPKRDATIPDPTSLPPPPPRWKSIQTFPYVDTYQDGAPILPRITLLPEWPKWTANDNYPLTPIPYWPQVSPANNWPSAGPGVPRLPPVPASNVPPWPNSWLQSQPNAPHIQMTPRIMPLITAERIFRSADDLIFNPQKVQSPAIDRPTQAFTYDSTGTLRQEPAFQGGYSWFVTIAPTATELDGTPHDVGDSVQTANPAALQSARQYSASVVVCQNRILNLTPPAGDTVPGEWMVPANVNPGSLGGGETRLFATTSSQSAWLATLRPGQWLMLTGITVALEVRHDPNNPTNYLYWPRFNTVAIWYRIAATDDGSSLGSADGWRDVTLNGPDWPQINSTFVQLNSVNIQNQNLGSVNIFAFATVVEGVVGVYQKTITLDGDSAFSAP